MIAYGQNNIVPDQVELNALKALWQSTNGASWTNNSGWPDADNWPTAATATQMDNWYGITVAYGDIIGVNLSDNNLNGVLPAQLGSLTRLQQLYLQKNKLSGSLPAELGRLVGLIYFVVHTNQLSGTVPPIFSGMTYLSDLYLYNNRFSGTLPPLVASTLDVSNNQFVGEFPSTVGSPVRPVWTIAASNNGFTSISPSLSLCPSLVRFDFNNNELTTLPSWLASHPNKTNLQVTVQNNRLDFSVLELYATGFRSPALVPQKPIKDQGTQTLSAGGPLVITARRCGANTTITWEKEGLNGTWTTLNNDQDTEARTYTRNIAAESDAGKYRWRSVSGNFPGAAILSDAIEIKTPMGFTLDNWCFQYKYDGRRRMTHKKVPGADWVYMVYDERDRLVMTQDGEQRKSNKWTVTKYDAMNRAVVTAIYSHGRYVSQQGMDSLVSKDMFVESYNGAGVSGYTSTVFPTSNLDILTATYYDNYTFVGSGVDLKYRSDQLKGQYMYNDIDDASFPRVVGSVTGTKVKVLEAPAPYYLMSVNYYDDRGRIVQTVSENYDAGVDRVTSNYDFTGKITGTRNTNSFSNLSWNTMISTRTDGNCIVRVPGGGTWGGASSVEYIPPQADGWVEATVTETTTSRFFGLSDSDPDTSPASIDYAFYLSGGSLYAYEFGVFKYAVPGGEIPGDRLRIARSGTTVRYYKNGTLVYTAATPSSGKLIVDISLQTNYARILNVNLSTGRTSHTTLRLFDYDHAGRLIATRHSTDNGDTILLSKNEYNEIGQLIAKKLYSTNSDHFQESIDYRYNIRGWITSMRSNLFKMQLIYNDITSGLNNTPQFNGNISAMRWTNGPGLDDVRERAYRFSYDSMNRLTNATQRTFNIDGSWHLSSAYHEAGVTYDLNGNIRTLLRTDKTGLLIDSLRYDYGSHESRGNALRRVTDAGTGEGFEDVNTRDNDYLYDANGNMVSDKNKGITSITYNNLNLPGLVTKSTGESIQYIYDATGKKLSQVVKGVSGVQSKQTDYHGEYIYENDTLRFISHEEGRVLPDTSATSGFTYEYHLKDHLGNVRLTFTTKDERPKSTATFETETADFLYYDEAVKINSEIFDHTEAGSTFYSTRLNGTSSERYGVAKSLSVIPGDTVNMRVFVKYLDPDTAWTPVLAELVGSIANGTAPAGTFKDGGLAGSTGGVLSPFFSLFADLPESSDDDAPRAYLNWLVFDRDYVLKAAGSRQISTLASEHGEDGPHEQLSKQLLIKEPGYVYVYLTNDTYATGGGIVDVFFDDFEVEHIKSRIVQVQDYYPFGMVFGKYEREKSRTNAFLYNQGSGEKKFNTERIFDLKLNIDQSLYRTYDFVTGRWWQSDPKGDAARQESWSNYQFAFDNPIRYNDPNGDCPPGVSCNNPLPNMQVRHNRASNLGPGYVRNGGTRFHAGHDLHAPTGTIVNSTLAGTVVSATNTGANSYGNTVVVKSNIHPEGQPGFVGPRSDPGAPSTGIPEKNIYVQYSHLETMNVTTGATVTSGQSIGTVGTTGNAQGMTGEDVHLHINVGTSLNVGGTLIPNSATLSPNLVYNNLSFTSADPSGNQSVTGVVQTTTNAQGIQTSTTLLPLQPQTRQ